MLVSIGIPELRRSDTHDPEKAGAEEFLVGIATAEGDLPDGTGGGEQLTLCLLDTQSVDVPTEGDVWMPTAEHT